MSGYVFALPDVPALAVRGSAARYPVRRIFCVARNYAAHAKERGAAGEKSPDGPAIFTKSAHALAHSGTTQPYPPGTRNYHHEMELVVALGASLFNATSDNAPAAIYGYACGLDMTRRDLQDAAKAKGMPWDLGKDCEGGAVVSEIVPAALAGRVDQGEIVLRVNGEIRQRGDLADMMWSVAEIVAHLSHFYHLDAGDLIFTGTPAGVGAVQPGDHLEGAITGIGTIVLDIGPAEEAAAR